jgi:hypothetical protein
MPIAIAVFGRSRSVVLDSYAYGRRRARGRVPRWLLLVLGGTLFGAAAVLVVQQRYLPARLTAAESTQLRESFARADADRQRLQAELEATQAQLQAELTTKRQLAEDYAAGRAANARLRDDLATVVASLPPDPRGGQVEVRAAQFSADGGVLNYDIVLLRDSASRQPMPGVLQFMVAGESARGQPQSVALKPITLMLARHQVVRGSAELPEGFKPRQTTVQVLDQDAGKPLGMRVLHVR